MNMPNSQNKSTKITGLSDEEVKKRYSNGQHNSPPDDLTRSIKQIIIENTFTLFNLINIALAVAILSVSELKNVLFLGVVIINTSIGIFQEVRAKKTIDSLSLLSRTKVLVLRNSKTVLISQDNVVLDDILVVQTGDQICADGKVIQGIGLEIDESLLTGESDYIQKRTGDSAMSGSFVVSGQGYIQVTAVGQENYVSKIAAEAKVEKRPESTLIRSLNKMMKYLTISIVPIGLLLFYSQYHSSNNLSIAILGAAAAMLSMIPEGLMLLTSIAFAVGAAKLAQNKILVQSLPCIETLARVDTLCLDKTGTITDGSMNFEKMILFNTNQTAYVYSAMCALMHHLPDKNATAKALRQHYHEKSDWQANSIIPFSSSRKWSGVSFENHGTFLIGAPEFLFTTITDELKEKMDDISSQGYRVMGVAHTKTFIASEAPQLPLDLKEIGLIVISDNIRSEAKETFAYFAEQDVTLKVISGDNPRTTSFIAQRVGIKNSQKFIDMTTVTADTDYAELAEEYTIFGRVTPYQKRELIRGLKKKQHTTCMTGDGVNDVLSLREADVGVAMASGSDAARTVSDVVLLNSEFSSMIHVLKEGRRVINNIERVASMYLVKTIYSGILAIFFIFLHMPYPFAPLQLSPINAFTVGIPSFFLALKPSYQRTSGHFINNIIEISIPAALTIVFNILVIQIIGVIFKLSHSETSTLSVLLTGAIGFIVLIQLAQPLDWKRKLLVIILPLCFISTFVFFGSFFTLNSLFTINSIFYLPLLIASPLIYHFIQNITLKVNNWFNHKKTKSKNF